MNKKSDLENHPLFKWLEKNSFYTIYKINDVINSLETYPLDKDDKHILINMVVNTIYEYLGDKMKSNLEIFSLSEHKFLTPLLTYLFEIDKEKKTNLWKAFFISAIDRVKEGRLILDNMKPSLMKQSMYRDNSFEFFIHSLSNSHRENDFLSLSIDKKNEILEFYSNEIKRYNKTINWDLLINKSPLLSISLLSNNFGYKLKSNNLILLYNNLVNNFFKHSRNTNLQEEIALIYSELLLSSDFFKHSLAPTKDVHLAVAKFLKIPNYQTALKNIECDYFTYNPFIKEVVFFKGYDLLNYEFKMNKHSYFKLMGKHFLNEEEKKIFNEKKKHYFSPVKKQKI